MKKIMKWFTVSFCILLIVLSVSVFSFHKFKENKESSLLENNTGKLIDFNGKKMNVYSEGQDNDTFVFMAGSAVAAPMYELKSLYHHFSKEDKIAVVERAGYGYSDVFNDDRDIDVILEQTREALMKSGNKPPYILVPHSISGIEAIYWAQKYPKEVKAIVALDIGLPSQYIKHPVGFAEKTFMKIGNALSELGFQRVFPTLAYNEAVLEKDFLTPKEKEIFKAISNKQGINNDMQQEILHAVNNSKKSAALPIPKTTPILFIDAYLDKNSEAAKASLKDYQDFAKQLDISNIIQIKSKHSIYLYHSTEIYEETQQFLQEMVEK
ncbi:alpha/beta hydrolase [Lysinibacillus sp. FSL K6-3209]|uniref:alpha/beta fold hydrolase n=1 Tax=Lysinibacillus sp. FSL K6-3209 TaxID=2921497 RepID=UPI0030D88866